MPSQIVTLPASLLSSIAAKKRLGRILAAHDMWFQSETAPGSPFTMRITCEPLIYCPDAACTLRGDAFVVLLTSSPVDETGYCPLPLPDSSVYGILETLEEAILGVDGFTGHERMSIARSFNSARNEVASRRRAPTPKPCEKHHQRETIA